MAEHEMTVTNDAMRLNTFDLIQDSAVTFAINNEAVLVLDEKGMTYKGILIEDAGEAHRVFLEVLYGMRNWSDSNGGDDEGSTKDNNDPERG